MYLPLALKGTRTIAGEQEAEAYAKELWAEVWEGAYPEGSMVMNIDPVDESYHIGIVRNEVGVYSANFLNNGLVQALAYSNSDARWYTAGEYTEVEPAALDEAVWTRVREWVADKAEKLDPGIMDLVEPMEAWQIRDVGDAMYISILAVPKGDEFESGLNVTVAVYRDGRIVMVEYSLYGLG